VRELLQHWLPPPGPGSFRFLPVDSRSTLAIPPFGAPGSGPGLGYTAKMKIYRWYPPPFLRGERPREHREVPHREEGVRDNGDRRRRTENSGELHLKFPRGVDVPEQPQRGDVDLLVRCEGCQELLSFGILRLDLVYVLDMDEGWLFVRRDHEALDFCIDWSIHGLSILCSETRHGVSAMVTTPWCVLDFIFDLQETKAPTGESPLRIGEVQYPTEGMVIQTDDELLAFQVRPQLKNCPEDCQTLLLRGGVITFCACQTFTPVADRTSISFRLGL
jgi:hypothetical protein